MSGIRLSGSKVIVIPRRAPPVIGGISWAPNAGLFPGLSPVTPDGDYGFGAASYPSSADAPVGDGSAWNVASNAGGLLSRASDATEPKSPPYALDQFYPSGTDGASHVYLPVSAAFTEIYACFSVYHDPVFWWNPISVKLWKWENGNILFQDSHNSHDWDGLTWPVDVYPVFGSFYVGATDTVYDRTAAYDPVVADFRGKWAMWEVYVKRGAAGRLWAALNGNVHADHVGVPIPTAGGGFPSQEIDFNGTYGGAPPNVPHDQHRRIGHVTLLAA